MVLLGVILLLAGIGTGVYAYVGTHAQTATTTVTAFGFSREATPLELVGYGVLAMLLFALGWALITASARRRVRARRTEREGSRVDELEERSESERLEHERRFEEAGLRDEDLRRREAELAARHEGLNQREAELSRREGATDAGATSGRNLEGEAADGQRTAWTNEAPTDSATPTDSEASADSGTSADSETQAEPPARPAETRGRAHDAPHQTV